MNNPGGAAAAGNAQIDLMSWYVLVLRCVRIQQKTKHTAHLRETIHS